MTATESQLTAKVALLNEAHILERIAERVDTQVFNDAVDLLCPLVGFTAVGKSGHVARRAAASFSSVGLASVYVDSNEALHGDLGLLRTCSVIIAVSNSGWTKEVNNALLAADNDKVIAIVGDDASTIANRAAIVLDAQVMVEVDPTRLVPTASLVAQSAWCDALMIAWMHRANVSADDFRRNHPGGAIGVG